MSEAERAERCRQAGLDPQRIPRHVAVIMDGNGRWAKSKGWERVLGHRKGAEATRVAVTESVRLGVERLTLYTFSSENWERPRREVDALMHLLVEMLRKERETLDRNRVRLTAIGQLARLPDEPRRVLDETIQATAGHQAMTLCLALSYGGRDEIADAVRAIAALVRAGTCDPEAVSADLVQRHLYDPMDVDVVVRTAGEQRLSNFLPWQAAYAEYISLPCYWPDFDAAALHGALREYQGRERRFGKV